MIGWMLAPIRSARSSIVCATYRIMIRRLSPTPARNRPTRKPRKDVCRQSRSKERGEIPHLLASLLDKAIDPTQPLPAGEEGPGVGLTKGYSPCLSRQADSLDRPECLVEAC